MNVRSSPLAFSCSVQHTPGLCLSADDLAGLNALYPDCSHAMSEPVCTRSRIYLGWVRLTIFIFTPIILALLMAMVLSLITQRHNLHRVRELSRRVSSLSRRTRNKCDSTGSSLASTNPARKATAALSDSMVPLERPASGSSDPRTPRPPKGSPSPSVGMVQLEVTH